MLKDGDLREVFANIVQRKGPESATVYEVKGHATAEMVQEGRVHRADKRGSPCELRLPTGRPRWWRFLQLFHDERDRERRTWWRRRLHPSKGGDAKIPEGSLEPWRSDATPIFAPTLSLHRRAVYEGGVERPCIKAANRGGV